MKKIFYISIFTLIFISIKADGGQAFAFLKNDFGVRATGMGGSFVSLADDVSCIYYNPAGLLKLNDLEFSAETHILSFGRNLNYVALGKPFEINKLYYATGFSWINFSSGSDIEERKTNSPEPESKFSNNANIFVFSTATRIMKNFYIGGNFKFLFQNIKDTKGSGIGFDFGVFLKIFNNLNAGFTIQNISTNINWNNTSRIETLPQYFLYGFSYEFENLFDLNQFDLICGVDMIYAGVDYFKLKLGSELFINKFLAIRAGYNGTLTFGIGIKLYPTEIFSIKIDYSFLRDFILEDEFNHRIGITFDYVFPHWGIIETEKEAKKKNYE